MHVVPLASQEPHIKTDAIGLHTLPSKLLFDMSDTRNGVMIQDDVDALRFERPQARFLWSHQRK